jgi:hypothetical protein
MTWRTSDEVLRSGLTARYICNTLSDEMPIGKPFLSAGKLEGNILMSLKISTLHAKTSLKQVKRFGHLYPEFMIKYGTPACRKCLISLCAN